MQYLIAHAQKYHQLNNSQTTEGENSASGTTKSNSDIDSPQSNDNLEVIKSNIAPANKPKIAPELIIGESIFILLLASPFILLAIKRFLQRKLQKNSR